MTTSQASRRSERSPLARRLLSGRAIGVAAAIAVLAAAALCTKVVKIVEETTNPAFNAVDYANEYFEPTVMPWIAEHKVDLVMLLAAIDADEEKAKVDYGNSSNPHNAYSYPVTFTGVAGEVADGILQITVEGVPTDTTVYVSLVPGTSTSLRDVTGLVDLNQFVNQVEYLNASLQFNYKAEELIMKPFVASNAPASLTGKTLEVTGAYTDNVPGSITVMPSSIKIVAGSAGA